MFEPWRRRLGHLTGRDRDLFLCLDVRVDSLDCIGAGAASMRVFKALCVLYSFCQGCGNILGNIGAGILAQILLVQTALYYSIFPYQIETVEP